MTTLKICICGDKYTGKTTYLNKLLGGEQPVSKTLGVEVHSLYIRIRCKEGEEQEEVIKIDFWDIAGDDNVGGLRDCYFIQANGVLIFDAKNGFKPRLDLWMKICNQVLHPDVQKNRVLVLSKSDLLEPSNAHTVERMKLIERTEIPIVPLSCAQNTNIWLPLQVLLRVIYKKDDLVVLGRK